MRLNGIVCIPAGAGNSELQMSLIHDLGVKGYVGTPTFLMNLVKKAEELGYDFRKEFKLRTAFVGAEPLLPEVRDVLQNKYGISLHDGIGVGVGLVLRCECGLHNGMHITEEQFVEIVDPETGKRVPPGEVGAVVVTGFSNNAFPMIRYKTGDLSSLSLEPCPCGRTSPRMMGVIGRVGESVKVRGIYLTPGQVKTVAAHFAVISKCQVIIRRTGYKDELDFNMELSREVNERNRFCEEFQTCFQDACRLRIDRINIVPKGAIHDESKTIVDERTWLRK